MHPLKWNIVPYEPLISQQCLNVILAGCKDSDLSRAEDEVTHYVTMRSENDDVSHDMVTTFADC